MPNPELATKAWMLVGMTLDLPGILSLADGRFAFVSKDDEVIFDVPISEVSDVTFPWYYFGGGAKFTIGGERCRVAFVLPTNQGGTIMDIPAGRRTGKLWRAVLQSRA